MRITALVRGMFLQWLGAEDARGRGPKAAYWKLAGNVAERSPFEAEIGAMRVQMDAELVNMGLEPHRRPGDISTEIHFRRLAAAMHDEDYGFLGELAGEGAALGVDEELPRTPQIFEEKTSWRVSFAEGMLQDKWATNYERRGERGGHRAAGEGGGGPGHREEEAAQRHKGRLAVASLGAVPKEINSGKVRIIQTEPTAWT